MSLLYDASRAVDPLGDADQENAKSAKHNRAKVGSSRPSTLLYTYGPGAIMDLPQFTIMPTGLDDWDRIWNRREGSPPQIHAPRLRDVVRMHLRSSDVQLRPHPWQPKRISFSTEGNDLGVPARVFPQWLRCTGCDMLGLLSRFGYTNTHPFRTDLACFEHTKCTGRPNAPRKAARRTAIPARYLLACAAGHLDEFPYDLWVHHGQKCQKAEFPALRMIDRTAGKGASAMIRCESCEQQRPMNEAQGQAGAAKLPKCRGRHPHLDAFEPGGCGIQTRLMLIGASNLWFPATQSIIVMPESAEEKASDLADRIRVALGDKLAKYAGNLEMLRDLLDGKVDVTGLSDDSLRAVVTAALAPPPTPDEQEERLRTWDPVDLLVPEWRYLLKPVLGDHSEDPVSGLTLSVRERGPRLREEITRVLAVERLRKVNALTGFTRIDALDRVGDVPGRLVPLTRSPRPAWTVATEDRGEGIFLQLDEERVASWEERVLSSDAVAGAPRRAPAQLLPAVLRDGGGGRPGLAAEAAAVLAGPHPRARADPPDGHDVRLLRRQPERAAVRLASSRRPPTGGGSADRHDRIRQRRHPRRPGPAQRAGPAGTGRDDGPGPGDAVLVGPDLRETHARRTRRISCTGRRATAA